MRIFGRGLLLPAVFWAASICGPAQIVVYHEVTTVEKGTTYQFTAYVPLSSPAITWLVNGIVGGNSTIGTVTQNGLYRAPVIIPVNNVVAVQARSVAFPNIMGAARATISQPRANIWSISPAAPAAGAAVTLNIGGSLILSDATVTVNNVPWPTTFVSSTRLRATGTFPAAGAYAVRVTHPAPGATASQAFTVNVTVPNPVNVTVTPTSSTVALSATRQFTANVPVTWTASAGTITAVGLYTAPATMPASTAVIVRATSTADTTRSATAAVTLQAPTTQTPTVSPASATVALGATRQFASNMPVTWTATAGTITAAGLYTAPATMPATPSATVRATSTADASRFVEAAVTLQGSAGPGPVSPAYTAAARLLDQAAFGPTPAMIAEVQQKGANTWIEEQLAMAETDIPLPADNSVVRSQMLNRFATAPDQLRQRVAWALGGFLVVSIEKNPYPDQYVPHLRTLSRNAFGNYRTLLRDITLSPQMGKYLDLANSNKTGANENYPREMLQLFSIGTVLLNIDGTATGTPAYTQADVRQFALALTGWTYPTAAGAQPRSNNWEEFSQPAMEPRPDNHDTSAKTLLNGTVLPAGQTIQQNLEGVIDNVFNHPNVGPFVAVRLIRALVTSNPTPSYIQRVAQVFNNNGAGVRGDLKAVVRAILTDAEARNDQAGPASGRLKDPLYYYVSFVRTMGGTIRANTQMAWVFSNMGQPIAAPASVFGYYSPNYRVPSRPTLFGPEFQIYTPTESVLLANELHQLIHNTGGDPSIDLSPFLAAAANLDTLLDTINQRMYYGRMSAELRSALYRAAQPGYNAEQRMRTAVYLAALSGQFAVQY